MTFSECQENENCDFLFDENPSESQNMCTHKIEFRSNFEKVKYCKSLKNETECLKSNFCTFVQFYEKSSTITGACTHKSDFSSEK